MGHILTKPKDRVATKQKTHVVYYVPCGDCEKEYLCETKRQFGTHSEDGTRQKAVSILGSSKSALAEHVRQTNHNIAWNDSKVITTNDLYGQ